MKYNKSYLARRLALVLFSLKICLEQFIGLEPQASVLILVLALECFTIKLARIIQPQIIISCFGILYADAPACQIAVSVVVASLLYFAEINKGRQAEIWQRHVVAQFGCCLVAAVSAGLTLRISSYSVSPAQAELFAAVQLFIRQLAVEVQQQVYCIAQTAAVIDIAGQLMETAFFFAVKIFVGKLARRLALSLIIGGMFVSSAYALPQGGAVVGGGSNGNIGGSGNVMDITGTGSNNVAIKWEQFNIQW